MILAPIFCLKLIHGLEIFWRECQVRVKICTFATFSQNWGILADFRCHGRVPDIELHNSCQAGGNEDSLARQVGEALHLGG